MSTNLEKQLQQTQAAARILALSPLKKRNLFLRLLSAALIKKQNAILYANLKDLRCLGEDHPLADRLRLSKERILAIANDVRTIAAQGDPLGRILEKKILGNGLKLEKRSVPFGVIASIYESRPNVTIDSACLAIKTGNAIVLKGGRESEKSNLILVALIKDCLRQAGLPPAAVTYLNQGREAVAKIMTAQKYIDVIIPRGGPGLINFVRQNSWVPVIETGAGVCHTYVDSSADLRQAARIVHNAKTSRPTVCNALDALILHQRIAKRALNKLSPLLAKSQVIIYADRESYRYLRANHYPYLKSAQAEHFGKEFLSLALAVKVVSSLEVALKHIDRYSSKHSEAIIAGNKKTINIFLNRVDAACVYANASTRFTDGSQFGLGGEIGISTQKLHARGPLGLKELTTYKWIILGQGQIRV
ncbi:MAG: glutamate-5-semialdehyde dehydrogenase [Patescibacteria group bacterium]|nr:glutamate-5-semialdehyde dehydrogenase [Patescibacteria group bacterium]